MSSRDRFPGYESGKPTDPFSSSADESIAATDDFLSDLGSGKSPDPHSTHPSSPSSSTSDQSGNDRAKQGSEDVKQKMQEAAGTASSKADELTSKAQDKAGEVQDKAKDLASTAQEKAGEVQGKAQDKADQGIDAAASGLGSVADTIRQQGEQRGGSVGSAATRTADTLEHASQYLRDKDSDQLLNDLESLVRQKPVESLLVAAGVGFILSKLFR